MGVVLVVVLAEIVAWAGSLFLGVVSFAAPAAAIGLRRYLIPGTPALAQRYLSSQAMAYLEHGSVQTTLDSHPESVDVSDRDRDSVLVEHGAFVPCDGGVDLCLTDVVRRTWTDVLDAISADVDAALSESALVDAESFKFAIDELTGDFVVSVDGVHAGRRPSCEALLANAVDVVALMSELPGWHELSS